MGKLKLFDLGTFQIPQKSSQNPCTRPSKRKIIEIIFPQIKHIFNFCLKSQFDGEEVIFATIAQASFFFNFFAIYYSVYLFLLCFFNPWNASIIGVISMKISKIIPFSGGANFEIIRQIAPIIQAYFYTFFAMYYSVYIFLTLEKRLHYRHNLTDNF